MGDKGDGSAARLTALLVHTDNLGDNFPTLLDIEHVTLVDVELGDDVGIVQRGTFHNSAAQEHRVKVSHRSDDARAPHLKRDELQLGALALGGELVGDCPTRRLGCGTQVELLAQ